MLRIVLVACALTGCDLLFQLERVPDAGSPSDVDVTDADSCPTSYIAIAGSKYRVYSQTGTWDAAKDLCAADGNGVHLVVLGDEEERLAIAGVTSSIVWVGLTDRVTQQTWKWVTDEPTSYPPLTSPPWGASEPSNNVDEDCAVLGTDDLLRDRECIESHAAVCECDGRPIAPAANF